MWIASGRAPREIVEAEGLVQVTDVGALEAACRAAVDANPKQVAQYKGGNDKMHRLLRRPGDEGDAGQGQPRDGQRDPQEAAVMSAIEVVDFDEMLSPLRYDPATGVLSLLDQRLLPEREVWVDCRTVDEVARAIKDMVVRGAPAIGCAAAYGMAIAARTGVPLEQAAATLRATRPTAVNLFWAIDAHAEPAPQNAPPLSPASTAPEAARAIHARTCSCASRSASSARRCCPQGGVLTHCNAGALATGGYGTALGVIRARAQAEARHPRLRRRDAPVPAGRAADRVGAAEERASTSRSSPTTWPRT